MNKLLIVVGPTGTGKTSLGLKLADKLDGEIISADSRQIYQNIDYSTNKLSVNANENGLVEKRDGYWLQNGKKIHLYDVITPQAEFNVSQYLELAYRRCVEIWERNRVPIVVGGTGFYIDVLIGNRGYGKVLPNSALRNELFPMSLGALQLRLNHLDKDFFLTLSEAEKSNRVRLVRFIEIAESVGAVKKGLLFSPMKKLIHENLVGVKIVGLSTNLTGLYERADQWVNQLTRSRQFINEMQYLNSLEQPAFNLVNGIIIKPGLSFVRGELDEQQMRLIITGEIHDYIRRQIKWFRRRVDVGWFDVQDTDWKAKVAAEIGSWYDANGE
jgi:tRNA dimethylallyltransferase